MVLTKRVSMGVKPVRHCCVEKVGQETMLIRPAVTCSGDLPEKVQGLNWSYDQKFGLDRLIIDNFHLFKVFFISQN